VTLFDSDEREREGFRRARTFVVHDHPLKVRWVRDAGLVQARGAWPVEWPR
jgi:hypothetical protein